MLWYKGWLETRLKLVFVAALLLIFFVFVAAHPALRTGHGARTAAGVAGAETPLETVLTIWIFIFLAGAGIMTQPVLQATKGIHGSTLYTLSLPVSRLRLVLVRAGLGWLESAAAVLVLYYGTWLLSPALRENVTLAGLGEYVGIVLACGSALYFLPVFLATFLDEMWRIYGTMIFFFVWISLSMRGMLPAFVDVFGAMGKGSGPAAHTLPWSAMGFSLGLSVLFFVAALTVARAREY